MGRKYTPASGLPEFDFDNLPDDAPGTETTADLIKPPPQKTANYASEYEAAISAREQPVSTGATGNRSAELFSKDRTFDFHAHDWLQRGRELACFTCPENHSHGTIISAGTQLVGERGNWKLIPEGGHCKHGEPIKTCKEKH